MDLYEFLGEHTFFARKGFDGVVFESITCCEKIKKGYWSWEKQTASMIG